MDQASQIEPLYVFAVFMLGSLDAAFTAVCDVMGEHVGDRDAWLPALVARLVAAEKATRVDRFAELNDVLRTDSTVPVDLSHPFVQGDVRRLNLLLWELQRSCLTATLRGITPERRAVFTLMHVLGLSVENTAAVCGTSLPRSGPPRAGRSTTSAITSGRGVNTWTRTTPAVVAPASATPSRVVSSTGRPTTTTEVCPSSPRSSPTSQGSIRPYLAWGSRSCRDGFQ